MIEQPATPATAMPNIMPAIPTAAAMPLRTEIVPRMGVSGEPMIAACAESVWNAFDSLRVCFDTTNYRYIETQSCQA